MKSFAHALILLGGLILFVFPLWSQPNLVPNPGFETYSICPSTSCQWSLVSNWNNVNGTTGCNNGNSGTPDYFHTCGTGFFRFPETLNARVNPLGGSGAMGLGTWLSFSNNFREYISVQLSSPLQIGKTYVLSFSYTNGIAGTGAYGGFGTRLGAHFSNGALTQNGKQPIQLTPTYESPGLLFSTTWQTISFTFTATANHTHITLGNFRNDNNTVRQQFRTPSGSGYAYYYFDDISVTEASVLPIAFETFQADREDAVSVLRWKTEELTDRARFLVEASRDGTDFSTIGEVKAQVGEAEFQFKDAAPGSGEVHYRVRFIGANGEEMLSQVRTLNVQESSSWNISPNPITSGQRLRIFRDGNSSEKFLIHLLDPTGRIVLTATRTFVRNTNIQLPKLAPGVYQVRVQEGNGQITFQRLLII
ncbi:MAG: T9SS type A sorting domain-containing protein [Bacteroidota bacterium]